MTRRLFFHSYCVVLASIINAGFSYIDPIFNPYNGYVSPIQHNDPIYVMVLTSIVKAGLSYTDNLFSLFHLNLLPHNNLTYLGITIGWPFIVSLFMGWTVENKSWIFSRQGLVFISWVVIEMFCLALLNIRPFHSPDAPGYIILFIMILPVFWGSTFGVYVGHRIWKMFK